MTPPLLKVCLNLDAVCGGAAPAMAGEKPVIDGTWLTQAKSQITIDECPEGFCGDITKIVVPEAIYNGDRVDRLPGNAHFSFPGCEGDALLMLLDANGVGSSTGSACSGRPVAMSAAMRRPNTRPSSSEFEASRFAPCTPVQATSPHAYSPAIEVRPCRSVRTPPDA